MASNAFAAMQIVTEDVFVNAVAEWRQVPFCQQAGWWRAQATHYEPVFLLDGEVASVAYLKKWFGFTMLLLETPAKRTASVSEKVLKRWYEAVWQLPYDIIEINSAERYAPEEEIALRQAGWLRPVGCFSFPLTNNIDLSQPVTYNENWRRNLKQVKSNGCLSFAEAVDSRQGEADFWRLYQAMCRQKRLPLWPNRQFFHNILTDNRFRLFFVNATEPVAAILIHTSGSHAGLLYAANNAEGYRQKAGFYMYDCLLRVLQQEGFRTFDMEKLGVGKGTANAVALFKQGIHGQPTQLLGEWTRYRRHWMRWGIYFLKKYVWHRTEV